MNFRDFYTPCDVVIKLENRFKLDDYFKSELKIMPYCFGFGDFGATVYYRTYSRKKDDGSQEKWPDTVIRATEGCFSARKNYCLSNHLPWDEIQMQTYAFDMAKSMLKMDWIPPGRGLFCGGTDFMYNKGAAALNNCGYTRLSDPPFDFVWMMDMLMCGCGIGISLDADVDVVNPNKDDFFIYHIPDSREGWCQSIGILINSYISCKKFDGYRSKFPRFNYENIRLIGTPLKGFGGTASGPDPLIKLHKRLEIYLDTYVLFQDDPEEAFSHLFASLLDMGDVDRVDFPTEGKVYNQTRLFADISNAIGCCVVSGNVRRSSEILLGDVGDQIFLDLKNSEVNPERTSIMWMSNNTAVFKKNEDFAYLPDIIKRSVKNGEPGFFNRISTQKHGRVGKRVSGRELEEDKATGLNPCGEIPLEDKELCNLSQVILPRCIGDNIDDLDVFLSAVEYATFYASSLSLLPTHWMETNSVIARNRRIGVSLSGVTDVYQRITSANLTTVLRRGHDMVKTTNIRLAAEAGVPESIRKTTIKPDGSTGQIVGCSSGCHFNHYRYAIRRIRVSISSAMSKFLIKNGMEPEIDSYSDNTFVFSFPIKCDVERVAEDISIWEQVSITQMLQREWAENAVSVTLMVKIPEEEGQLELAISQAAPTIKSCSFYPIKDEVVYAQPPYEKITEDQYDGMLMPKIDFSKYGQVDVSDGEMPVYCTGDYCVRIPK